MPHLPIVGSSTAFEDCPAYYLRERHMNLPAEHLLENGSHVASFVSEWAFEVESGTRMIDTLTTKGRSAVHLYMNEKSQRERRLSEMRRENRG